MSGSWEHIHNFLHNLRMGPIGLHHPLDGITNPSISCCVSYN